jgi:hypothetical protein
MIVQSKPTSQIDTKSLTIGGSTPPPPPPPPSLQLGGLGPTETSSTPLDAWLLLNL